MEASDSLRQKKIKFFFVLYLTHPHILRHTFATRCIEAGMKPKTLQMLLGHSNIGITMNLYVHTTEEEKKKEMDLVAEALMAM